MCLKSLLCGPRANLWPFYELYCKRFSLYIYGRFMGFYVNGFLSFYKSARGPYRRDVVHILSKVSCFFLKSFHFRRLQKR